MTEKPTFPVKSQPASRLQESDGADMWLELHDGMHAQDYLVHIWRLSIQRRDIHLL